MNIKWFVSGLVKGLKIPVSGVRFPPRPPQRKGFWRRGGQNLGLCSKLALAAMLTAPCHAGQSDGFTEDCAAGFEWCAPFPVTIDGGRKVTSHPLFADVAPAGESEAQFVIRIGEKLRRHSEATHFEACGYVAQDASGRLGIIVTTSKSHVGCAAHQKVTPDGMTSVGRLIHSHGVDGRFVPNEADAAFMGVAKPPKWGEGFGVNRFSKIDKAHPGYLAGERGVIFTDGRSKVSDVGAYPVQAVAISSR